MVFSHRRLRRLSRLFQGSQGREVCRSGCRSEGYDAIVEGVPAYSTLGKFDDPILNTMMGYGDDELAAIMFHELAHQVVYIPDDSSFNEAFAVTVEREGLTRWLAARGRSADLQRHRERRERQAASIRIIARHRDRLSALYSSAVAPELMRGRKAEEFAALVDELKALDCALRRQVAARRGARGGAAQQRATGVAGDLLRLRAGLRAPARDRAARPATLLCRGARSWPGCRASSVARSCAPVEQVAVVLCSVKILARALRPRPCHDRRAACSFARSPNLSSMPRGATGSSTCFAWLLRN